MDEVMKNMKTVFDESVERGEAEPIVEVVKRAPKDGTPPHIVAKRRYRNKVARKQRKINAKRSK